MSVLSHRHRFLFVHVAKTGGRSIGLALREHCSPEERFNTHSLNPHVDVLGRRTAMEVRSALTDEQWSSYFKFAFVRNPWDRTASMYYHIRDSRKLQATGKVRYLEEITRRLRIHPDEFTFEIFVKEVLRGRVFDNYHWDKQIHCFCDDQNNNVFDFIGRFENLQADFDVACDQIGLPRTTLGFANRTKHAHYSCYYTDETEQIVADLYPEDIDLFGYSFERVMSYEPPAPVVATPSKKIRWMLWHTAQHWRNRVRSRAAGFVRRAPRMTGSHPACDSVIQRLQSSR